MNGTACAVPFGFGLRFRPSECEAQGVLHHARLGEFGVVEAESGVAHKCLPDQRACRIETHRVSRIKHLPCETQGLAFGEIPDFRETRIKPKETWAAEVVALSGFPWIRRPEGCVTGRIRGTCTGNALRVLENARAAVRHEYSGFGFWTCQHGRSFQLKVGSPSIARLHREGEAARPSDQAVESPAAENCVNKLAAAAPETAPVPEG